MYGSDIAIFLNAAVPEQALPNEACIVEFYHDGYKGGYQLFLLSDRRVRFVVSAPACRVDLVTESAFPFNDLFFLEARFSSESAKLRVSIDGRAQDEPVPCIPRLGNDLHNYHQWLNRCHRGGKGLDLFVAEFAVYTTLADADEQRLVKYFLERKDQVSSFVSFHSDGFGYAKPGTKDLRMEKAVFRVLDRVRLKQELTGQLVKT